MIKKRKKETNLEDSSHLFIKTTPFKVCSICLESFTKEHLFKCEKLFMCKKECAVNWLNSCFQKGEIRCFGCSKTIQTEEMFSILEEINSSELNSNYHDFLAKQVPPDEKLYHCYTTNCDTIFVGKIDASCFECSTCKKTMCVSCQEDHTGLSCEEAKKFKIKDPEFMETISWKEKNTKSCPKCKVQISWDGGCIHLVCPSQHHFCWECGSEWKSGHASKHINQNKTDETNNNNPTAKPNKPSSFNLPSNEDIIKLSNDYFLISEPPLQQGIKYSKELDEKILHLRSNMKV